MRLPAGAHTQRPWLIHEVAHDFRLEDVWALPARGGPGDFPRLVEMVASMNPSESSSWPVRTLFAIRWRIGELLGWDEDHGVGGPSIRSRVPTELRHGDLPRTQALPFETLYLTDDEWAAETANRTMHGVVHIGRVPDGDGFRAQMAVLVKPNGLLGEAYMAAIKPFRYLIVYPRLMTEMNRRWKRG